MAARRRLDAGSDDDDGKEQGAAGAALSLSFLASVRAAGWLAASNSVPLIFREKMDVRLERR